MENKKNKYLRLIPGPDYEENVKKMKEWQEKSGVEIKKLHDGPNRKISNRFL